MSFPSCLVSLDTALAAICFVRRIIWVGKDFRRFLAQPPAQHRPRYDEIRSSWDRFTITHFLNPDAWSLDMGQEQGD